MEDRTTGISKFNSARVIPNRPTAGISPQHHCSTRRSITAHGLRLSNRMKIRSRNQTGSTLVVTIVIVSTLLVLLGVAVDYSTQVSRVTQRSRKTAVALEIADGHLETLFT